MLRVSIWITINIGQIPVLILMKTLIFRLGNIWAFLYFFFSYWKFILRIWSFFVLILKLICYILMRLERKSCLPNIGLLFDNWCFFLFCLFQVLKIQAIFILLLFILLLLFINNLIFVRFNRHFQFWIFSFYLLFLSFWLFMRLIILSLTFFLLFLI